MIFSNNGLYGSSSGIILDPVHGAIQYFDHEKLIFDHFLFQRLRFILQTDVVNLVFPGSNHDRFQHSLGTMHMAGKMFATLIEFYLTEDREYGASAKLEEKHINAIQYINWILRTAALLHDVGTMPFSHQFEFFLERKKELKIRITDLWKDGLEILKNIYGKETYENVLVNTNSEYYIKHEDLSLRIAYQILTENYKDNEAKSIKNIFDVLFLMEKREEDISNYEYLWDKRVEEENLCFHIINFHSMFLGEAWEQKCEKGVEKQVVYNTLMLFRGIISCAFDADKMHFIVRDSFFIGSS